MTCIGRPSLSSGRGAELVEAERGDIDAQAPLSRITATAAPGRPLLPYGQFTLSPQGEPSRALRAIHLVPPRGAYQFDFLAQQFPTHI